MDWMVAGAVIEGPEGLLLVQNRRRNGALDWSTPGGVIDKGEGVLDGLTREVVKETGLTVTAWEGPLYRVEVAAPGLGWHLLAEVHLAAAYSGEITVQDPDGIVVDARFVPLGDHHPLLVEAHPWVRDPLCDWLAERWPLAGRRTFGYDVDGERMADLSVSRRPLP